MIENSILIQSGTCEEYGLSMPTSKKDCQQKGIPLGINDNNVNAENSDNVCGCRAFNWKSRLDLKWNNPNGVCTKNNKKCKPFVKTGGCVCVSKGMLKIFKIYP